MEVGPLINSFKESLVNGNRQVGLWLGLADPYCAEICAAAGFDWLLIDGEHAPNDLRSMLAQLQAVAQYPVHPVVRLPSGDVHLIKQVLDIGAQTLMIPMVESADQARHLVSAMRYPPAGIRGLGSALARASVWNHRSKYLDHADDQMCLLVQIETLRGIKCLDAIARVDGVDGLFVGPADLAASLGHRGNPGHPAVRQTIEGAIASIRESGKQAGVISTDEAESRRYFDLGCTFVAVGADTVILSGATQRLAQTFKQVQSVSPLGAIRY